LELGAWSLELGAWSLELGAWSLELGAWSLELGALPTHRLKKVARAKAVTSRTLESVSVQNLAADSTVQGKAPRLVPSEL